MTTRQLPSLNALRAFEASARHQSFTLAAHELHVTPGAVSHQVRALEDELGLALFERLPSQLRLTPAGLRYRDVVGDALDRLARGTAALHATSQPRLAISTSPNFAARWLVPQWGAFSAAHPEVALRLEQSERQVNFSRDDIDVAIRYGNGNWPGLSCTRLSEEFLLPVCAPSLVVDSIAALARQTLLHVDDQGNWARWLAMHGAGAATASGGMVFNQDSAAIEAALAGQGVALARASLVVYALRQQRLVAPLPLALVLPLEQAYWLVTPPQHAADATLAAFSAWLLQAFAADRAFWQARG